MTEIFTIGHSTRSVEEMLGLLQGIEVLADVRTFPGSRRCPQFGQQVMQVWLANAGIEYRHFPKLGGRRKPNPNSRHLGWRELGFQAYADYMDTDDFAQALEALESVARQRRTAVMCAEAVWWRCHRRLLADALTVRGWTVWHILSEAAPCQHELTPFAVVDGLRLSYPVSA